MRRKFNDEGLIDRVQPVTVILRVGKSENNIILLSY